ncbi:MAG: glycosyltransferase family 2 protein [Roseiflexaceae bacterium]
MQIVEPMTPTADQRNLAPARPLISVVAPVYNEEALLPEFYRRTVAMLEGLGEPFEIVLVNDGSRDRCPEIMRELHQQDPRVKVLNFSKNFGHQIAITAGMDYAQGQTVVVIDSDLQDPPEVIPQLLERWREGYQVVYAQREQREGETRFKKATAALFYRTLRRITNVDIPVDTGDFRLMDRRVVEAMKSLREQKRFMRGLSAWVGFKQIGVLYKRDARKAGETKYPLRKMIRFALDGITAFSYLPLQMASYVGFAVAVLGVLGIFAVIILRLAGLALTGQATTLVMVLFLGGVQLIFLGIIGEYLGRIYDEVKRRPLYIIAEELGFDGSKK